MDMDEPRKSLLTMALDYDIVQVVAFDRLYFITREEFVRLERRSQLLWELHLRQCIHVNNSTHP